MLLICGKFQSQKVTFIWTNVLPLVVFISIMVFFHPKLKANFKLFSKLGQSCQTMIPLNAMNVFLRHREEKSPRVNWQHWMEEYEYEEKDQLHGIHKLFLFVLAKYCLQGNTQTGLEFYIDCSGLNCVLSGMDLPQKATTSSCWHTLNKWEKWNMINPAAHDIRILVVLNLIVIMIWAQ